MTALSDAIIAWFEANAPDDIKDELIADISDSTKTSEDSGD